MVQFRFMMQGGGRGSGSGRSSDSSRSRSRSPCGGCTGSWSGSRRKRSCACVIHVSCVSEMILFCRDLLRRGSANISGIGRREGSGVESKCRLVSLSFDTSGIRIIHT